MNQQPKTLQTILLVAVLALVLVVLSSSLLTQNGSRLAYSDVLDLFENERVESFVLQGDTLTLTLYGSDAEQAGTATAKIGGPGRDHRCAERRRRSQVLQLSARRQFHLEDGAAVSARRHRASVRVVHPDEPLRQRPERHGAVYACQRALRRPVRRVRDLPGRRRCGRGKGRSLGDRGVPPRSGPLQAARREDPEGRAARRPAGHRQDAAGPRSRRRGECRILIHFRLRLRRTLCRRRREPCPRPL